MSVYFIHAEVLKDSNVVTKVSGLAVASNASNAYDLFMGSSKVTDYQSRGGDVIIDKLEKVE